MEISKRFNEVDYTSDTELVSQHIRNINGNAYRFTYRELGSETVIVSDSWNEDRKIWIRIHTFIGRQF